MYKIYGREACSGCVSAKNLLKAANIPFMYVDIDVDNLSEADMTNLRGKRSLPVVYVEYGGSDIHVGGFSELRDRVYGETDTLTSYFDE